MVWSVEQVEAVAPSPAAITAAQPIATPSRWSDVGADERVIWGSFQGSGAEPYDTAVDHVSVGFRCTCPSRKVPCKHAIALLLMWAHDQAPIGVPRRPSRRGSSVAGNVPSATPPPASRPPMPTPTVARDASGPAEMSATVDDDPDTAASPDDERDTARDERVERMLAGLTELDRWLDDRMRTGLADPALARYSTWDDLAARLVDAQAGSLANRIRRLAGLVGASATWHDDVLAELGLLHLFSQAGRRLRELPGPLADAVATSVGWQVRRADVLGGVPDTDHWVVAGRSDQREDRIEVRRHWLRGTTSGRWALVLSFAAYQQSLDTSLEVGTTVHADLHRYPGPALRALVGKRHLDPSAAIFPGEPAPRSAARSSSRSIRRPRPPRRSGGCSSPSPGSIGSPPRSPHPWRGSRDGWFIGDDTGALPILAPAASLGVGDRRTPRAAADPLTTLLALSAGRPVDLTIEWTPHGVVPLAVHLRAAQRRHRSPRRPVVRGCGVTVEELWTELVTTSLLGTDRRDPPEPGGMIGDVVADTARVDPSARMLAAVAACTAVRRAGVRPADPVDPLAPPPPDDRPECIPAAVDRWHHVTTSWPVLEDEWMLTLVGQGWRLAARTRAAGAPPPPTGPDPPNAGDGRCRPARRVADRPRPRPGPRLRAPSLVDRASSTARRTARTFPFRRSWPRCSRGVAPRSVASSPRRSRTARSARRTVPSS